MTAPAPSAADARASNWRYVVPSGPTDPVVVGADDVPIGRVLDGPALAAIVTPDLAAWYLDADGRAGRGARSRRVLADLSARTAPGGWLCVGVANRWYAAGPLARGSMGLGAVRRELSRNGLTTVATYIALPDHRHPAVLVPGERAAELDHVLRRMLVTYVPGDAAFPRLTRRALSTLRAAALRTPHGLRLRLLPGYLVVAERPR